MKELLTLLLCCLIIIWAILSIFLPFFVLKIRNQTVQMNTEIKEIGKLMRKAIR